MRARHDGLRMPSLSQRYRPHSFADVTGQAHITEPLRRGLATSHLAHCFLFSGPRGVGKTTTARVLAQALVCAAPREGEPCGACESCQSFQAGTLVDIIELDAATHTGVELVREAIIEHARFVPMMGKRKVYILDEAHMLSTSSWNALLKTLEEPPAHAYFILATTESHKVPATIVSRCQRYDFRRIPDQELADRVRAIAQQESWTIDDEVVRLIVSRSEGCLRDAETLLGQLAALGETHLTLNLAHLIVPPSRFPVAAELFTRWTNQDLTGSIAYSKELFETGVPLGPLFDDLLVAVRLLLVAGALPNQAQDWESNEYRVFLPLVGKWSASELHDLALCLIERRRDIRFGIDPLFLLELTSTVACHRLFGRGEGVIKRVPEASSSLPVSTTVPTSSSSTSEPESSPVSLLTVLPKTMGDLTLDMLRAKWTAVINVVDEKNHSLPFVLKISRPEHVEGGTVTVRFQYPFHYDKIVSDVRHRKLVEEALQQVFGTPLQLAGVVGEEGGEHGQKKSDMISNILKAFGGTVVE